MSAAAGPEAASRLLPGALVPIRLAGETATLDYEIVRELGFGAHNVTYLARGPGGDLVALKASRWAERSDATLQIEAGILGQLDHEHLLRLLGTGSDPQGRLVLAYPRCFPNPLLVLSKPEVRKFFLGATTTFYHPLPAQVALNHSVALLQAIEHLHQQGFVHHDVKPTNMMVHVDTTEETMSDSALLELAIRGVARLVLIDIGASRSKAYLRDLNAGNVDDDQSLVPPEVTPLYAPPEALLPNPNAPGNRPLLHASLDLYASALVVYSNVTGRAPYDHLGLELRTLNQLRAIKKQERAGELLPISHEAISGAAGYQQVASDLYTLLSVCLDRDPMQRPSVGDTREFMERIRAGVA